MSTTTEPAFSQADVDRIVGERLARDRQTRVLSQPRKYALDSPHSWFGDIAARADGGPAAAGAVKRLGEYERELGWHMAQGTPEGRRAESVLRGALRGANPNEHERRHAERVRELRAFGTDGGASATSPGEAAAFVSPAFLMDAWAPYRGIERTFADQCHKLALPSYGMQVYLPFMSGTAKAGKQTEGSAVAETAPTAAFEGAEVKTITGQLIMSLQMRDRAFTGGGSVDVVIYQQIRQQLDQEVDAYVLAQALSTAEQVTGQAEYKTKNLYQDLALAREKLTDTAGTRLRATHLFTTADLYSYATRQVDATTERPIMTPTAMPGFPLTKEADTFDGEPHPKWARFTGTVLPGAVLWFCDDNIPTIGTLNRTQLIVSAPDTAIVLMEDEPVVTAFTETLGNTMRVVLNLREYCAAITRHAAGTASVTSAAYTTALV